jgi:hypothetical protein
MPASSRRSRRGRWPAAREEVGGAITAMLEGLRVSP